MSSSISVRLSEGSSSSSRPRPRGAPEAATGQGPLARPEPPGAPAATPALVAEERQALPGRGKREAIRPERAGALARPAARAPAGRVRAEAPARLAALARRAPAAPSSERAARQSRGGAEWVGAGA